MNVEVNGEDGSSGSGEKKTCEEGDENCDPNEDINIPRFDFGIATDKAELVETAQKLMRENPMAFVESETEKNPLIIFGRRLTHVYLSILKEFPLFKRFEEMCKLKALSQIL